MTETIHAPSFDLGVEFSEQQRMRNALYQSRALLRVPIVKHFDDGWTPKQKEEYRVARLLTLSHRDAVCVAQLIR
jgi:hypothetical protein